MNKMKELIVYGLEQNQTVIDEILQELNVEEYIFEIRLILSEALLNAFFHGNKEDITKPIILRYNFDGMMLNVEVEDCGTGLESVEIPQNISEENILKEDGRGLFLINSFSDEVKINNNRLIIKKALN